MRWFSHRARTWKDTVLKIKIKKKAKGFTLVATALAVLCWIFIAQAFFMMSSGTLSTVKAERTAYQAEQNTALDVSRLKALDYDDLDSKGAHARKVIEGVGDGNWESEVTIDPEQPLNGGDDDAKLRIAHVKVYRTGDTTSRYSLDVPLTSQSMFSDNGYYKFPNGLIMQWGKIQGFPDDQIRRYNFNKPFEHECFALLFTTQSAAIGGGPTSSPFSGRNLTKTTFEVNTDPQARHGRDEIYMWLALGY
jgi:hypothetical protein